MNILSQATRSNALEWYEAVQSDGAALLIDKERSWTSFDVVARLRSLLKVKKIGHAGTLDPLATGLLIICCGRATKKIEEFQDLGKEYQTVVKLGATTSTYDAEGAEENVVDVAHVQESEIHAAVMSFLGRIEQIPPMFSARKVGGRRLYQIARKGLTVTRGPGIVEIHHLEITKIELPFVWLTLRCSKGTYVRSLAHDIGQKLGCGAYMHELRRTAIGEYQVEQALRISEMLNLIQDLNRDLNQEDLNQNLNPIRTAAEQVDSDKQNDNDAGFKEPAPSTTL